MKKLIAVVAVASMLALLMSACTVPETVPEVDPAAAEAALEQAADIAGNAEMVEEGGESGTAELSPRFQLWYDSLCLAGGKCHAVYRAQNANGDWVELVVGGFNVDGSQPGDSLYYAGMADGSYLAMSINGAAYVLLEDQKLAVTTDKIDTSAVEVPGALSDVTPVTPYTTGTETLFGEELDYDQMTCRSGDQEQVMRVYVKAGTDELRYIATEMADGWYYLEIVSYSDEIPEQFTKIPDDYTVMDASALADFVDPGALSSFDLDGLDMSGLDGLDLSALEGLDLDGIDLDSLDLGGLGD